MENNNILILSLISMLKRNKVLIILALILAVLLAYANIRFTIKKYTVGSTIVIEENNDRGMGKLFDGQMPFTNTSSSKSNELILLRSRKLLQKAILTSNSSVNYYYENSLGFARRCSSQPFKVIANTKHEQLLNTKIKIEILNETNFILSYKGTIDELGWIDSTGVSVSENKFDYNNEHKFGTLVTTNQLSLIIDAPLTEDIQKIYYFDIMSMKQSENQIRTNLIIESYSKESNAINVIFSYPDIEQAKRLVNTLVDGYLNLDLVNKKMKFKNKVNFINNRINEIVSDLYKSELKLEKFQRKNKSINLDYTSQKLYNLLFEKEAEKESLEFELSYYNHMEGQLSSDNVDGITIPSLAGIDDNTLNKLVNELSQINIELKEAKNKFNDINPIYKDKIVREKYLRETVSSIIISSISNLELKIKDINNVVDKMEKEVFQLPKSQRELIKIKRDFELNNKVYTFLLEKRAEANIQMASTFSDKKIVDTAMLVNDNYTYPNKKLNYALYIVFIFGGLLLFLILKAIFFAKIDSLELVRQYIPMQSFLGDLPHCKSEVLIDGEMIIQNSLVFEKLRMITSNLKFKLKNNKGPIVIGVTSYIQGEGKSFFSKNIGHSLTLSDNKVLFVDADMRKTKGMEPSNIGLSNYLSGNVDLEQCIVSSKYSSYDQISHGPLPPNPIELLESESMTNLIKELKTNYDFIFLDLPPVGIIADWNSIKDELDHTIYLIRENYSPIESIKKLVDMENNKISYVYNDNKLLIKEYYSSYYKK